MIKIILTNIEIINLLTIKKVTLVPPVLELETGEIYTLKLPTYDADGVFYTLKEYDSAFFFTKCGWWIVLAMVKRPRDHFSQADCGGCGHG